MTRGGAPEALALALSPLLQPLRLLSRAGLARVAVLREIEFQLFFKKQEA